MTVMDELTCCEITFKRIHFPSGEVKACFRTDRVSS
jgi:hypothetical protein